MAQIRPFHAIRYNTSAVGRLSDVLTPPYDVISPEEQAAFHKKHPKNFIRLDLGIEQPGDGPQENRYTRAAGLLRQWLAENIFQRESQPAIFLYDQTYTIEGRTRTRRAFVALVRLEPYGSGRIFPHEQTHAGPKLDRLELMKATLTLFSQVFGLYPDESGEVSSALDGGKERTPICEFDEPHGGHSLIWRVIGAEAVRAAQKAMEDKPLYIADGHHRYETSLNLQRLVAEKGIRAPGADCLTMACVSMNDPGLMILPTHRAVQLPAGATLESFFEKARRLFTIRKMPGLEQTLNAVNRPAGRKAIGVYSKPAGYCVLDLLPGANLFTPMKGSYSETWRFLDVSILHCNLLKDCLGFAEAQLFEKGPIFYSHLPSACIGLVDSERYDLAFFLRPSSLSDLQEVVRQGEKMPPKSTFFYPKLMSGLFLHDLKG